MFSLFFMCFIRWVSMMVGGVLCSFLVLVRFMKVLFSDRGLIVGVSLFMRVCI